MASKRSTAVVLSPDQLQAYSDVDPELPALITRAGLEYHRQQYIYALAALGFGFVLSVLVILGFIYLVMNDHEKTALTLLGGGVLTLITAFLTIRLGGQAEYDKPEKPKRHQADKKKVPVA